MPAAAITLDLHDVDLPEDIVRCGRWFAAQGVRVTAFIPSAMLEEHAQRDAVRALAAMGHELGSHSHHHDLAEMHALMAGRDLGFLERSRDLHAECFGTAPCVFRAPRWCTLAPASARELVRLGYTADSSATPQRAPWLSSFPMRAGWWRSARTVHALVPGLVEVPTSCLLVPAGTPTFRTLRAPLTQAWLALLATEARLPGPRALVVQMHVEDVLPDSKRDLSPGALTWRDLLPRAYGGWRLKLFLRERDPQRAAALHRSIVASLRRFEPRTIGQIAAAALAA